MLPKQFLTQLARDVSKRCGICQATVEQVLPAVFDEIRQRLVEGRYPCVPIESFGVIGIIQKPERQYKIRGKEDYKLLPPKKVLKFYMARNFRNELEAGAFDPTRKSFSRHPKDPALRYRSQMNYRKDRAVSGSPEKAPMWASQSSRRVHEGTQAEVDASMLRGQKKKAAIKREQDDACISHAEREQARPTGQNDHG